MAILLCVWAAPVCVWAAPARSGQAQKPPGTPPPAKPHTTPAAPAHTTDTLPASDPAVFKAFLARVNDYLDLQKKLEPGRLKTTDQPARIDDHEQTVADRIRDARAEAKPGDIFGDAAPAIRQIIAQDAEDRARRDSSAAMAEVPAQSPVVNAIYPEEAALATVPALLLLRLPKLPEGIEYRFMGRSLILRDVKANLIVDFIREAVPTSAAKPAAPATTAKPATTTKPVTTAKPTDRR